MGQYHYPVNLTKREFLNPHHLGDGLKEWEQVTGLTPKALYALTCYSVSRGGGDIEDDPDVKGRWHGDAIAIVGDYAEDGDFSGDPEPSSVYQRCNSGGRAEDPAYWDEHVQPLIDRGLPMYEDITDRVRDYLLAYIETDLMLVDRTGWFTMIERCPAHHDKVKGHDVGCIIETAARDVSHTRGYVERIGHSELL